MLFFERQGECLRIDDSVVSPSVAFYLDFVRAWLVKSLVADVEWMCCCVVDSSKAIFFVCVEFESIDCSSLLVLKIVVRP